MWSVTQSVSEAAETREWRLFIADMIQCCEKVFEYTAGLDEAAFPENSLVYDATLRNIEIIGEAAAHIPEEVRAAHPEIPWRAIIGTRNRIAHAYPGIDNDVIWDIVQTDLPEPLPALQAISASAGGT